MEEEEGSYVYKLHASFVSMRKQILNVQRGNENYGISELLPHSFMPALITRPFSNAKSLAKNGIPDDQAILESSFVGRSVLENDYPYIFNQKDIVFTDEEKARLEAIANDTSGDFGGVNRLTLANIKNGNFLLFQDPPGWKSMWGWIVLSCFLIILHLAVNGFERFGYKYVFDLSGFNVIECLVLDPILFVFLSIVDFLGLYAIFAFSSRALSLYLCFVTITLSVSVLMFTKYVSFGRVAIELFIVFVVSRIRRKLCYKWFATNTLEA